MLDPRYRAWQSSDCVRKFAEKDLGDFFGTETHFLDRIGPAIGSALDVGCASGRFAVLLRHHRPDVAYTGVDLVEEGVAAARGHFPEYDFHVANALDFAPGRTFDLVNATGVVQHEPAVDALLDRLVSWSHRYVLFDCKATARSGHLVDRDTSFVTIGDDRLFFVVLSFADLCARLRSLPGVASIAIHGYETKPNDRTTVPDSVLPFASLGVLLERGEPGASGASLTLDVPEFLEG